jgi:hypothetical protein
MPKVLDMLKVNAPYAFIAVGVAWLAIAVATAAGLVLWPVVACFVAGALLKLRPALRVTWAWALATASLGFLLSAYQVYAWAPFLGGTFTAVAGAALVLFAALALAHIFLFYLGASKPKAPKSGSS